MCAEEKQFGDALYILNSMRFSIYPPSSNPPPSRSERAASTWIPKPDPSQPLSSTPSSIDGYTFIDFGQPVPTRLACHSFLHSLVKAGLPTKAAAQAELMMADGIKIHTKTMESILASTVDKSSYPPIQSLKVPLWRARLESISKYPIANTHTRVAVHLLEEARRRRQERTQQMYDIVINACLIQGEIIVASLLFIILIKDWQLRRALKNQNANNPPSEPPQPLPTYRLRPTMQLNFSLLERIDNTLTTRKDPQDPLFQNAIQALANLAFAVDTGQFPKESMARLIKALYSVPSSHTTVQIGSPPNVHAVNAYKYIHKVLMRLVRDAGGKRDERRDLVAGRRFNKRAFGALTHYCLRHRQSKFEASRLLDVVKEEWPDMSIPFVTILFRASTLLRDDTIRTDRRCSARTTDLPLTRWAHIVDVLKLEYAAKYPSKPLIQTPANPGPYTVTCIIAHLTATGRGHIIAEKLIEILPELNLVNEDGSRIPMKERGRRAASYGPYFFTTVLNALVKGGRTVYAQLVWNLAVEAEKASQVDMNKPWFLPIHAYTCMLQQCSKEARVGMAFASPMKTRSATRITYAMTMGKKIFRAVQTRCRFLETTKERDHILSQLPPALRKFTPDGRYFNALLDLYARRALGYARPIKNRKSSWRSWKKVVGDRFSRSGKTTIHWHPMLAEIVAEMRKYGYEVPEGLRFLFVGRISGPDVGSPEPLPPVRQGPPPRQNPQRIPVFKDRGLPITREKYRRRARRVV